jgi:hypothetical protein
MLIYLITLDYNNIDAIVLLLAPLIKRRAFRPFNSVSVRSFALCLRRHDLYVSRDVCHAICLYINYN